MGAVEHLKTLCCLGLTPESAMVAVTPVLHEIIPHGWTRMVLLEPNGAMSRGYVEYPGAADYLAKNISRFMDDPTSPWPMWTSYVKSFGIGWTLHMQGRGWLDTGWYREVEAQIDACWLLDAMVGDAGRPLAFIVLSRARTARPFRVEKAHGDARGACTLRHDEICNGADQSEVARKSRGHGHGEPSVLRIAQTRDKRL
jgi:hypothetical protein